MFEISDQPLVSIIIPTKNRCNLLKYTLASVQAQTWRRWEAIVVDDNSTDNTLQMLNEVAANEPRIHPIRRTGAESGAAAARNEGFAASNGEFVVFLDSDDLLSPAAIEGRLRGFQRNPKADAVVGRCEYFRNAPGEYHNECALTGELGKNDDPLEAFLTLRSPWITSGPLWRRNAVLRAGAWKTSHDNQYHTDALIAGIVFHQLGELDWYCRLHGVDHVSSPANFNVSGELAILDERIHLLHETGLLTSRNRRMLAWSCLLSSLTCAVEHEPPSLPEAKAMWESARVRKLMGVSFYRVGSALISLQWSRVASLIPREAARFAVYLDLKRNPLSSMSLLTATLGYVKYLFIHFRHWNHAQLRHASATSTS